MTFNHPGDHAVLVIDAQRDPDSLDIPHSVLQGLLAGRYVSGAAQIADLCGALVSDGLAVPTWRGLAGTKKLQELMEDKQR